MATPRQKADLVRLERDLAEAFAMIDSNFWATRSQRESYEVVLRHLRAWIGWTEGDADDSKR